MEISLTPEILTMWGSFPLTNTLIMTLCVSVAIFLFYFLVRSNMKDVPGLGQNIAEIILETLLNLVNDIMQDRNLTKKVFPLVATIFIFVWGANIVELVPGLGTIGIWSHEHGSAIIPFIRSASADLNMTLMLALVSVFSIQFFGIAAIGAVRYGKKFFVSPFQKPYGIGFFVGLLEIVSEVSKIISFSFRLFGNIFAGEVLLMVVLMLVPYLLPLPFLALELFVGFIQALVFSMLTLVFIKLATIEAH